MEEMMGEMVGEMVLETMGAMVEETRRDDGGKEQI